jgi:stress-induced-phosphoprotein 1
MTSLANALKEEGNKLFGEKKYQQAYDKYTSAIELDGENVFYYTNRAAALLEMKR